MADTTDHPGWPPRGSGSPADRLLDATLRLFVAQPVAASAGVLLVVAALSNSGLAGFVGFAIAMLFASHLRARYERDL
jgi:hypothetical protein